MTQVRICLACGAGWQEGSTAFIDGFCLHCPGELGPALDAADPAVAAATQAATAVKAGVNASVVNPENAARISSSTTQALAGSAGDDLEPGEPIHGSAALSKIHLSPVPSMPSGTVRMDAQARAGGSNDLEINVDALSRNAADALNRGASRRHPSAGTGDTTAVVIPAVPSAEPPEPLTRAGQTEAKTAAAASAKLPPKLAQVTWQCRDCRAIFAADTVTIASKRCSECGGKIQPELPAIEPGVTCLVLYDPDTRVRIGRFRLQGDVFLIGRLDPGSQIFPELNLGDYLGAADARQVSRRHCELHRDRSAVPESWYLAPVAGSTGVYVKGELVATGARVLLEDQTLFGVGGDRIFLRFEITRAE